MILAGAIRTMDPDRPLARAVAVEGSRIAAVLDEPPEEALRVACVLPGFTDAHVHFPTWALTRRELQLHGGEEEVLAQVAAARPQGEWLRGFGWSAQGWKPTRRALDAVTGDVPTALLAHDWHSLWVNSAALARAAGAELDVPGGVVDLEAGILREEAAWAFRDRFTRASLDELVDATRAALPVAAARGVTTIHDKDGVIGSEKVFAELDLTLRVWQSLPAERAAERPDYVKAYLDGTLGSRTARMLGGGGVEVTSRSRFEALIRDAAAQGVPMAVHAIGDRANRDALDAFEATRDAWAGLRPRIEHAQCVSAEDVPRFAELGITASIQPAMAVTDAPVAEALWADRLDGAYAYRTLHEAGARLVLGSDAPVEELDPLATLRAAVLREWRPHERLDLQTAMEACTTGPAWLEGRDARLRPGAPADLVVLDRDPFDDLARAAVTATMAGGQWVTVAP